MTATQPPVIKGFTRDSSNMQPPPKQPHLGAKTWTCVVKILSRTLYDKGAKKIKN